MIQHRDIESNTFFLQYIILVIKGELLDRSKRIGRVTLGNYFGRIVLTVSTSHLSIRWKVEEIYLFRYIVCISQQISY